MSCINLDLWIIKGIIVAAKTMAATAINLLITPLIVQAKKEFETAKGLYLYNALLGDRTPGLNYRD